MKSPSQVVIPHNMKNIIAPHELRVARILARHYHMDVTFLRPNNGFMIKTPDIIMGGREWEIKGPTSSSYEAIERQFKVAAKQAPSLIIDMSRVKLADEILLKWIVREAKRHRRIKVVLAIDKAGNVIEINKKMKYSEE